MLVALLGRLAGTAGVGFVVEKTEVDLVLLKTANCNYLFVL
jgi:hypothetical protein